MVSRLVLVTVTFLSVTYLVSSLTDYDDQDVFGTDDSSILNQTRASLATTKAPIREHAESTEESTVRKKFLKMKFEC